MVKKVVVKPYNNGEWTVARYNSFVMSALRKARWPIKYSALRRAFVKNGVNPKTGRKCKLHRCAECKGLFMQKEVAIDHIETVTPLTGFVSWDDTISRLFCEIEGFQILCKPCHAIKTKEENTARRLHKKKQTTL